MKTINKKVALGLIATATILTLGISNVSAMGHGNGMGGGQGKHKGQSEQSHNPSEMLEGIQKQDLSEVEKDLLLKQYEEEMMANELYTSFYEKYGIETFKNIANSESQHMEAVKALLDRYELDVPKDYNHIQDLYEQLKLDGSKSAFDALEVGVKIEFVDIDDIVTAIKSSDNDDIKIVLTNIGGASYNHLRGFLKAIDNNGYETKLDWKKYITEDDLNTRGPIKFKLAEKLENEGVELPNQVNSETMKNKKGHGDKQHGNKGGKMGNKKGVSDEKMKQYSKMEVKKNSYKRLLNTKYKAKIDSFSEDKLKLLLPKIDTLEEKVKNSSSYTEDKKISTIALLEAFREIIQDKLLDTDTIIDELLN